MPGTFTGRHMLAIMIAFFAVVIGVNLTMAMFARSSWTGFVVRNSYVASQEFNGKVAAARAQAELGWTADLSLADGRVRLAVADRQGRAAPVEGAVVHLRSPATDAEDRSVTLARDGAGFSAPLALRDGLWVAEIVAETAGEAPWRDTRRIVVSGGRLR